MNRKAIAACFEIIGREVRFMSDLKDTMIEAAKYLKQVQAKAMSVSAILRAPTKEETSPVDCVAR
jgi:hypothetical protein